MKRSRAGAAFEVLVIWNASLMVDRSRKLFWSEYHEPNEPSASLRRVDV
jgi:hypothetical protein